MNPEQEYLLQKKNAELEKQLAEKAIELEQKNWELEIEAALERVRAVAMGMKKREDMLEVCKIISRQLELLNVKEIRNVQTAVFYEEKGCYTNYEFYAKHDKLLITEVYYKDHPIAENFAYRMLGGPNKIWTWVFQGDELRKWLEYQKGTNVFIDTLLETADSLNYYWSSLGPVAMGISVYALLGEQEIELFKRFRNVFELAYRRYLDIEKAEAQAREAQIEAALERVRSTSLAMHHSDGLQKVVVALFEKLVELGLSFDGTFIYLYDKGNRNIQIWVATKFLPAPVKVNLPYDKEIAKNPIIKDLWNAIENGEDVINKSYSGKAKNDYFLYAAKHNESIPESIKNFQLDAESWTASFAAEKKSVVGFDSWSGLKTTKEDFQILKRFARVFEQAYTRFLDLQKAEAQAREAQIELGLEKVRARAMAMQQSHELKELISAVSTEIGKLDIVLDRCLILTYDTQTLGSTWWMANPEAPSNPFGLFVKYHEHQPYLILLKAWQERQLKFEYILEGQTKKEWDKFLFKETELSLLPAITIENMRAVEKVYLSSSYNNFGCLSLATLDPLTDEQFNIMLRFAKVFDLTYTRFNDLKQAEAQAREAQIEVALEKVRSRSLAMHKSDELREVVAVVFEKLVDLGFASDDGAVGILIFSPGSKDHVQWIVDPSNSYASSFEVAYTDHSLSRDLFAARESRKDFFAKIYPVEEKNEYFNHLFEYNESYKQVPVEIKNLILGSKEYGISVTFEKNSAIVIPTNSGKLVTEDNIEILKRFVRVFEQAYIRFLDLQKAETQAREAQIELALERVRARTMAMQKSDELREAVLVINEQLQHLGFDSNACNIIIIDKESGDMQYWVSGFTQEIFPEGYRVPYLPHPYHDELLAASRQNKKHDLMEYSGELKKSFDDIFFTQTDFRKIPEEAKNFMKALSSVKLSTAFFTYGALQVLGPKELTGERISILERFAKVFDLTYTRFLDLQKAETQAREAQIEAALERTRTQSMLMQHSSELNNVSNTFHEQLLLLGIPSEFSYVWLPNEEKADHLFWVTWTEDQNGSVVFKNKSITYPLDKSEPYTAACFAMWESGEPVHVIPIPPGEVKQYFATWEELLRGAEKLKAEFFPSGLYYAEAYMKYGCFGILICRQLTQEEKHIFRRFTIEFERAYTRFLDLQKAEAQTREAVKRASVDRLRAEIASMRNTSDLERITPLIWNELTTLGVPFMRCGVFIMDEAQQQVHTYLSTPDGKAIATFHLPYNAPGETAAIIEHWRKKEIYKLHWNEAQFIEFTQNLLRQGAVTTGEKYLTENRPTDLYLHFLPFLQGMLYAGNTAALNDDELQLMQDLADAFSTAYARYEDFNKLEAAKQTVEKTLVDLRQTQQQLVQSEKMASLGELTAGIAHEIQNPLNFVNNFSEVNKELLAEMNEEIEKGNYGEVKILAKDIAENEGKISHHGKRADAIVKGMLQHSRISSGQKEPTDINALCDEYLRLAYHGLRAKDKSFNAKFETKLDNSIGKINIIPQDIGRVLVNLINNAFYAVNEKQKQYANARPPAYAGSDRHDTRLNDSVGQAVGQGYEPSVIVTSKKEGDRIELRVTDNGCGIPQKVLDKIFQPFFTTKPAGQGTGLGLSLAYDIIKIHSGEIKVESKEGEGTTFIIRLPENS